MFSGTAIAITHLTYNKECFTLFNNSKKFISGDINGQNHRNCELKKNKIINLQKCNVIFQIQALL